MAYPLGLTAKSLAGIAGAFSATTGGVLLFNIGGESEFEVKVKSMLSDFGVKNWCVNRGGKFVCDKKKSAENLKKLKFTSKYGKNGEEYIVNNSYQNLEVEILESGDKSTFPGGIKLVTKNDAKITISRKNSSDKSWPSTIDAGSKAEFKFNEKFGKLMWVWEEINDMTKKAGVWCDEKDKNKSNYIYECKVLDGKTIEVRDGKKVTVGATMDTSTNKLKFTRGQSGFFQGYKFTVHTGDIILKVNGKEITDAKKVTKLDKNSSYQIVRDSKNETKWYLSKVGN